MFDLEYTSSLIILCLNNLLAFRVKQER